MTRPVVVVGEGWSALGMVGFLLSSGASVRWIAGSGARTLPPLAGLQSGPGVAVWQSLAEKWNVETGELQEGSFLREFRNKAFRNPEARAGFLDALWEPEKRLAGFTEVRFSKSLSEIEEEIRRGIFSHSGSGLTRTEGVPVTGFFKAEDESVGVILGTGERVVASRIYYADRWNLIPQMEGLPKPIAFLRGRHPVGVLQASLIHEPVVGAGLMESFLAALHREPGEEIERHLWGYFSSDGKRSTWSLALTSDEGEDNHIIAKKLRRMKATLDKVFTGEEWVPFGKSELSATVLDEQVRFEEESIFSRGEPLLEPASLSKFPGVFFMTDGYGPSVALAQVGVAVRDLHIGA